MRQNVRTDDIAPRKGRVVRQTKARPRVAHAVLIGFGGIATVAMVGTWFMLAAGPRPAEAALVTPQKRFAMASLAPVDTTTDVETVPAETEAAGGTVTDIMDFRSAGTLVDGGENWMFAAPVAGDRAGRRRRHHAGRRVLGRSGAGARWHRPRSRCRRPIRCSPSARPAEPFTLKAPTVPMAVAPLPLKNPLGDRGEVAALPPPQPGPSPSDEPDLNAEVTLPGRTDRYAVYDIRAKTVYLPSGEKLEAHSGLGEMFDDPRHISVKMRGPTPPNIYELTPREALFHGVEALRMTPVDDSKMYGRDGILAHSYLLGPRGDSNGCVSFKNMRGSWRPISAARSRASSWSTEMPKHAGQEPVLLAEDLKI